MNMEFARQVRDNIKSYLPPEYREADVTLEEVTKGNDLTLTGLVVRNEGEAIVPTIYLEPYAGEYEQGRPMDEIMREIARTRTQHGLKLPFEVSEMKDYDRVKPLLAIRLFDPEINQQYMKGKPFTPCGDLAAHYRIQLMEGSRGTASAVITDGMLETWGITKEQLHQDAAAAESARNPVRFYSMEDVMNEFMAPVRAENLFDREGPLELGPMPMYVLTNANKVNGSGVLAHEGVLEKIGDLMGQDYFVLPSSVHEVLIVPGNGEMQAKELESIVREINATQVAPDEVLSDKVQYYDREAKTLGRKQEKGLLAQLAENKAQIKEQAERAPKAKTAAKQEPSL